MKNLLGILLALLVISKISAQTSDTISFIQSKRMSDADLAKKREGTFITGIPDFSSDPVTGFGVGVRANTYWNGNRSNPFFAYTPYLAKLKANVAYYTSNEEKLFYRLMCHITKEHVGVLKLILNLSKILPICILGQQNPHSVN